jgi:hypothetical protein
VGTVGLKVFELDDRALIESLLIAAGLGPLLTVALAESRAKARWIGPDGEATLTVPIFLSALSPSNNSFGAVEADGILVIVAGKGGETADALLFLALAEAGSEDEARGMAGRWWRSMEEEGPVYSVEREPPEGFVPTGDEEERRMASVFHKLATEGDLDEGEWRLLHEGFASPNFPMLDDARNTFIVARQGRPQRSSGRIPELDGVNLGARGQHLPVGTPCDVINLVTGEHQGRPLLG